jgi:UDP-N-acetylglucosamine transferase subunit ALG13
MEWVEMLRPDELRAKIAACDLVVGHAGMGTIIGALEHGKPIVVMPRLSALRETRNDHQVATAKQFEERGVLYRADDATGLRALLESYRSLKPGRRMEGDAASALVEALRSFILRS